MQKKPEAEKMGIEEDEDAQDHEPNQINGYEVDRNGNVLVEVTMESRSKRWVNYKTKVDIACMWEDCKDEEENLVLIYASLLDLKKEKKGLFDKIASLAEKCPEELFPNYSTIYKCKGEDMGTNDDNVPCCIQHDKLFNDTEYEEDPSVHYFQGQRKWSGKTCYNCGELFVDENNRGKRAMLPLYVCKHYRLEKGDCKNPFLCSTCYKHMLLNNDNGAHRRNRHQRRQV